MPQKSYYPTPTAVDPVLGGHGCPKCRVEMEPIDIGVEGLRLEHLQLCPRCYLVTWSDQDGLHVRQGVPMKKGVNTPSEPTWPAGEPQKC
jgi:hypothetical protein